MITYLFSVHTITEAKQYAGLGRAEPGLNQGDGSSSQVIWHGAPWCSTATDRDPKMLTFLGGRLPFFTC